MKNEPKLDEIRPEVFEIFKREKLKNKEVLVVLIGLLGEVCGDTDEPDVWFDAVISTLEEYRRLLKRKNDRDRN